MSAREWGPAVAAGIGMTAAILLLGEQLFWALVVWGSLLLAYVALWVLGLPVPALVDAAWEGIDRLCEWLERLGGGRR